MGKRKPKSKKSGRPRKGGRVGALSIDKDGSLIQLALGTVVGGIGKRLADNLIAKQAESTGVTIKQSTVNFVEMLVAGAGFYFMDQPFVRGLAVGIASATVYDWTKDMKLGGIGAATPLVPFMPRPQLNGGVTQTPAVAGASTNVYSFPKPAGVGRTRHYAGAHMR